MCPSELQEPPAVPALGLPVIVCVDDEAPILSSLRRALSREGLEVRVTQDPREALQWVEEGDVRVLITDHRMPEMTGLQLVQAAEARSPGIPCLLLTAYPDSPGISEYVQSNGLQLLSKPWKEDSLRLTIRNLLDHDPPASPWRWSSPDVREPLLELECRDACVPELLNRMDQVLDECPNGWILALGNLPSLRGSAISLVSGLLERITWRGLATTLIDPSGLAAGVLEMLGATGPIAVFSDFPGSLNARRVLVLESCRATGSYLQALIRATGNECDVFTSVTSAAEQVDHGDFDLAFLDLGVPEGGAIALSQRLLQSRPGIRLVGLSQSTDLWDEKTLLRFGIHLRLEKPFPAVDVVRAVHALANNLPILRPRFGDTPKGRRR